MRTTRRAFLAASAAAPALALPQVGWAASGAAVMVHDPALSGGQRFADAGRAQGHDVLAITGDRIRFAKELFARRPSHVFGISRHADALLIADVAGEAGYVQAEPQQSFAALIDQAGDRGLVLAWTLVLRTVA